MVFLSPPGVPLLGLAMLKSVFYTYRHVLKIISLEAQLHTSLSLGDIQFSITSVCFGTGCIWPFSSVNSHVYFEFAPA